MKKHVLKRKNLLFIIAFILMALNACGKNEIREDTKITNEVNSEQTQADQNEIDALIDSLEVYGDKEPYEKLYSMSSGCDNVPAAAGTWNRTNIHSSLSGEIVISDVNAGGFKFTADTYYYSHTGWIEGEAKFVTDQCAIAKYDELMAEEYIAFLFENQKMTVVATGSSSDLGFGMNVSMDGDYTQDEPLYTNANIVNEIFSEEELRALKSNLPKEYYEDFFLFSTTYGVVDDTTSDNGDRIIEAFVPTMGGYGYVLNITNGKACTITFEDETSFYFSVE